VVLKLNVPWEGKNVTARGAVGCPNRENGRQDKEGTDKKESVTGFANLQPIEKKKKNTKGHIFGGIWKPTKQEGPGKSAAERQWLSTAFGVKNWRVDRGIGAEGGTGTTASRATNKKDHRLPGVHSADSPRTWFFTTNRPAGVQDRGRSRARNGRLVADRQKRKSNV